MPYSAAVQRPIAGLDIPPPSRLSVGRGTAFAVAGYCYHPSERTRSLSIQVGDSLHPVEPWGLPRQDVYERLPDDDPARPQAYRSGFAALLHIPPVSERRRIELTAVLQLAGGREARVPLGSLEAEPAVAPPPEAASAGFAEEGGPRVAICMATYNPPPELLRRQLDSIRQQTHRNWLCLISDDDSDAETLATLEAEVRGDRRFVLARGAGRIGYYRNFERALSMAPADADFVTLCDQDDSWHPDKLERLIDRIGSAQLVYSDARVVTPANALIATSYWTNRRNNYTNFGSLLLANSVTGAAALFRREILDDALPFPPEVAHPFHDHWLAVVAMARGEIAYLDEPLYDYVQHGDAVIGHSQANKRPRPVRSHVLERLRNTGDRSRAIYYYDWYQQLVFAEVLRLRCWDRMSPPKRRTLMRLLHADRRIVALSWLLGRRVRRLWGHDETLDRELFYGYALARRRALSLVTLRRRRPGRWVQADAAVPSGPWKSTSA
jgi:glycosyltransferase involved in cell wall biosynthesis